MNMMPPRGTVADDTLGRRIRRARKARNWSLDDLGSRLGISKVSVWGWEHDRTRPKLEMLERLSAVLDTPVSTLLSGEATSEATAGLVEDCQDRIARALGLAPEAIEIKITFGGVPSV
jgi:transcriptional regulator with XRE-family HTH domain